MQTHSWTLLLLLLTSLTALAKPVPDWVTTRYGRVLPQGFYSVEEKDCLRFVPSGKLDSTVQHGSLTIRIYHGLYYSSQENPDTSKDQQASVEVLNGDRRIFVARGYMFSEIGLDSKGYATDIRFTHWTGVMGDEQVTVFSLRYRDAKVDLSGIKKYSTKTWGGLLADE